jgi:hypothetical protein
LGSNLSDSDNDVPQTTFAEQIETVGNIEADLAVADIFGEGVDMAEVRASDPVFADQLRNALVTANRGFLSPEGFTRGQAFRSASVAEFDELVALGELKRLWMAQAMTQPELCKNVMAGDFMSIPLDLGQAERIRERQLLRRLLDAGLLSNLERGGTIQSSVPGWVIDKTIDRSGLNEDQVAAALQDPGSKQRCLIEFTMLGVVLEEPGRVSLDLLKAL